MPDDASARVDVGATMSAEQATAQLEQMSVAYSASMAPATAGPAAQLTRLTSSRSWAEQFFAGSVDARRQFAELTQQIANANPTDAVLADAAPVAPTQGELTIGDEAPIAAQRSAVDFLREAGLNNETILQALTGEPVPAYERAFVQAFQAQCHGDEDWRRRFLSGGWEEQRQALLMAIALRK
jgi:hypothetical protein